jgi:uncharacterized membrane protein YuzA (DUF378 family)
MPWGYFLQQEASQSEIRQRVESLRWLSLPFFFLLVFLPRALLVPVEALVFSLFGYSAAVRFRQRLPFRCHFNIAVYGLTPAIAIDLLGKALGVADSLLRVLYVITAGIYIFTATNKVLASRQE